MVVQRIGVRYHGVIVSDDVCFCQAVKQTLLCINKELWISCGERYDCHISCVGDVVIQACVTTGEDEAFQACVSLPLLKWIGLDCYIQDSKIWNLSAPQRSGIKEPKLKYSLGATTSHSPLFSSEFLSVALQSWVSFWNRCKILNCGSFPAGKLQAITLHTAI